MQTKAYLNFLVELKDQDLARAFPILRQEEIKKPCLDFSSNDYLQLSQSRLILKSAIIGAKKYGVGSTGSRLLSGHHKLFETFETQIALSKKTERALLFNSGFQANISVLSALLERKHFQNTPLVFFDKLNHKSLYEAVNLSGAKLIRYAHNDMEHLAFLLNKYQDKNTPKFIVAETVYGMDGDVLKYNELVSLARQYHALLYLDEAHATGILGQAGYGLSTSMDFQEVEHVIMGTFSKALGGAGAYVACSNIIYQYLINACSGFIYSTACSPMMIGAMQKAWDLVPSLQPSVIKMFELAQYCRQRLKKIGLETGDSSTHIIPLIYREAKQALEMKNILQANHIVVSFIQYPTVPKNQARLRIALNISHQKKDIDKLLTFV